MYQNQITLKNPPAYKRSSLELGLVIKSKKVSSEIIH